jgi:hypothetical protein
VLTAFILICSAAVTPDLECTRKNAAAEMRVPPEFGNPVRCLMHVEASAAMVPANQQRPPKEKN